MSGLSKVLDNPRRVDLLFKDLLFILRETQSEKCRGLNIEQRSNCAVMLEGSSLVFSFLRYLLALRNPDRVLLLKSLLSELERVDDSLLCDSSLLFLQAANRTPTSSRSVESMVLRDIMTEVDEIKRDLSKEEKTVFLSFFQSEKFLSLLKNKFGTSKLPVLIEELTREGSVFRSRIPSWLLLSLETLLAGTRAWSWLVAGSPKKQTPLVKKRMHRPGGIPIGIPKSKTKMDFQVYHQEFSLWTLLSKLREKLNT